MILTVEQETAVNVDADAVREDFKIAVDFKRRMYLKYFWANFIYGNIMNIHFYIFFLSVMSNDIVNAVISLYYLLKS